MKVALVHDYLTQRGGAERVVLSMLTAFPDAPLWTSVLEPGETFPEFAGHDIRPMWVNRLEPLHRDHRRGLPLYAPAFSTLHVDADVVLCSSSGWAHGVRTTGRKVVYCYTPARWLYQPDAYLRESGAMARWGARLLRAPLLGWDRRAAATADRYLTSSQAVRQRIQAAYGRDAELVSPPHTMDPAAPQEEIPGVEPGFLLVVSRLLPYKNVDAVITATERLPGRRLVVVGTGPDRARLKALAGDRVLFLERVSDAQLRWLYANAAVLVAASYEDYGLTPLEAAALGTPAAVLRFGGFLDTVVEGQTGEFFSSPRPEEIAAAISRLLASPLEVHALQAHAARYDEGHFIARLREIVDEAVR